MFRHERPQKGRYRQFHQFGVEALGFAGPDVDVEHLVMAARLWKTLGLDGIELQINTLGDPASRARYRTRLTQFLERHVDHLDDDAKRRMHSNPLRVLDSKNPAMQDMIAAAPRLLDDLDDESLRRFELLQAMLRNAGVNFSVNPRLVRGLDYYNDAVYEWVTTRLGAQGTVCAGGRYDGLIEQIGGKAAPACGFAMGVERLLALIEDSDRAPVAATPDVYMVHAGELGSPHAWRAAERLRDSGLRVILHCGEGGFKSQMKRADASGATFACIVGDDEARSEQVSIKALRELREQVTVDLNAALRLMQPVAR
jgi:histidyl-tRNA synthetase